MSAIYFGVVEDRQDPLSLGRVKVRVIGLHTSDKTILPTTDLPWAYPILPVTSASISGVGVSPTGIVPGTWCVIQFIDSAFQSPIVMGTIPGIPQGGNAYNEMSGNTTPQPIYSTGEDTPPPNIDGTTTVPTTEGGGFKSTVPDGEPNYIGPLSSDDYLKLREVIAFHESGKVYEKKNSLGFIGRYQFGGPILQDLKYVRKGTSSKDLQNPEVWLGKNDIHSREDFYKAHAIQDECMLTFTQMNFNTISKKAKQLRNDSDRNHCAGLLMAAHLQGPGGAIKFAKGIPVNPDAYGTTTEKYYKLGYAAIDGALPTQMPSEDSVLPPEEGAIHSTTGFGDPEGIYPRRNGIHEADTNRLARGENVGDTIVGSKEAERTMNVRIAGSNTTWDQNHIPYAAQYPYNSVRSSEGGIIEEFDSTPNAVRYHLYHPSGTFTEIDNNGTVVNKIYGDKFEILERNGNIFIKGDANITVEGNINILSQSDINVEVYGNCNAVVKNDLNTTVHGNMNTFVQGDYNISANSFNVETTGGDINLLSSANIDAKCTTDFNIDAQRKIGINSVSDTTIVSDAIVNIKSKGEFNINSKDALKIQSGTIASIKAGSMASLDGAEVFIKSGASVPANDPSIAHMDNSTLKSTVGLPATSTEVSIKDPTTGKLKRQEHVQNNIPQLTPVPSRFDGLGRLYDSPDDGDNSAFIKEIVDKTGEDPTATIAPAASEETFLFNKDKIGDIVDADYSTFVNQSNIATGINISANYSLRQFLSSSDNITRIVPQHGLSEGEIVQNLQYLAVNIAEKVKEMYPEMFITSAYRYSKTGSQHEKGMAMDMQFRGTSKKDYYAIAVGLSEILSYDQLILEYKDTGTGMPWIHCSFNKDGNRGAIYTYFNHTKNSNTLTKLA